VVWNRGIGLNFEQLLDDAAVAEARHDHERRASRHVASVDHLAHKTHQTDRLGNVLAAPVEGRGRGNRVAVAADKELQKSFEVVFGRSRTAFDAACDCYVVEDCSAFSVSNLYERTEDFEELWEAAMIEVVVHLDGGHQGGLAGYVSTKDARSLGNEQAYQ